MAVLSGNNWELSKYGRYECSGDNRSNEYIWSIIDNTTTNLSMKITPTLQLIVLSSNNCIEECLDIWALYNCTKVLIRSTTIMFVYLFGKYVRLFRVQFNNKEDLNLCIEVLKLYFSIQFIDDNHEPIDNGDDTNNCLLDLCQEKLAYQQPNIQIRNDFLNQYLTTCLIDPAFFGFVQTTEKTLKAFFENDNK